jgi:hypothetical protein
MCTRVDLTPARWLRPYISDVLEPIDILEAIGAQHDPMRMRLQAARAYVVHCVHDQDAAGDNHGVTCTTLIVTAAVTAVACVPFHRRRPCVITADRCRS